MKTDDYTHMGKGRGRFPTTCWTVIGDVHPGDEAHNQILIGDLLRDYWKPVYCYLRRRGHGNEEAKDLTQAFFQEVVLGRELIQRADPNKGRFRTLVLTALDHYLANVHRGQCAQKRIPAAKLIPLEQADSSDLPAVVHDFTCEESFNYAWASGLLDRMLAAVKGECRSRGMATHWNLFYDRVLQPIMEDRDPPPLVELCTTYGIDEPTKASNMIFAVKRRFQTALKRHIRQSVACDDEISDEMVELTRFLGKKWQYSR
jgi:DNA-directed RNA polymerase specialized sigma24 family protein